MQLLLLFFCFFVVVTLLASADYTCINELKDKLSREVSNVDDWATANKLPLNSLKTKTILISGKRLKTKLTTADQELHIELNGTHLEQVDHVKLLGLELDAELSFNSHVQSLSKKMSKRIGILNRMKSYLPRAKRVLFYNAIMIMPLILYCCISWSSCNKDNVNKIFRLQKRCSRIILDAEPHHSTVDLFNKLGWLPFYVESDIKRCILAYKRIIGETPDYINSMLRRNSEQHSRRTRSAHLSFITPRYVREREAFTVMASKYWNNLPIKCIFRILQYCMRATGLLVLCTI